MLNRSAIACALAVTLTACAGFNPTADDALQAVDEVADRAVMYRRTACAAVDAFAVVAPESVEVREAVDVCRSTASLPEVMLALDVCAVELGQLQWRR